MASLASTENRSSRHCTFEETLRVAYEAHAARVFDEVITRFRVAPGGAQGAFGIRPDLTTLAKILAGGLPGGAVAGRKEVLDELDFEAAAAKGREKIEHPGTFNGNPVSAAAGIATLEVAVPTTSNSVASSLATRSRIAS